MALPQVPFKVKALAPYTPTSSNQLALVVGNIYEITETDGKGVWVQSKVDGIIGWLPFNYTQVVVEEKVTKTKTKTKTKKSTSKKPGPPIKEHVEKNKKNSPITVFIQGICFYEVESTNSF